VRQQMTVGKKFASTGGALMALALALGIVALYGLGSLQDSVQLIVTDPLPGLDKIASAEAALLELRGNVWRHIAESDRGDKAKMEATLDELKRRMEASLAAYDKTITTAEDRALFEKIQAAYQAYLQTLERPLELSRAGKLAESARLLAEKAAAFQAVEAVLKEEIKLNERNGDLDAAAARKAYARSRWTIWITLGILLLGGSGLVFLLVRGLNRVLRQVVAELDDGAGQVASAASQVSSSSQSLAQGANQQAASLEETSASSQEINSMARKNTDNSQQAAGVVAQSKQQFGEANEKLDQMVVAMGEINAHSDKISKIIKVIDEIAFQTNILALNAAVESARAGQAGMGFAVVADEVRNLSQRCAQAARDTASLIEESIVKSNDGKTKVDQVAAVIRSITEQSAKIGTLVEEVSLGSQEQARGIDQIAKAISQMEQVTQKNAASAEQSASASEELNAQSEALRDVVERLTRLVGTGERSAASPVSRPRAGARPGPGISAPEPHAGDATRSGLAALGSAVVRTSRTLKRSVAEPAPAAAHSSGDAFPMEEDFKEF